MCRSRHDSVQTTIARAQQNLARVESSVINFATMIASLMMLLINATVGACDADGTMMLPCCAHKPPKTMPPDDSQVALPTERYLASDAI